MYDVIKKDLRAGTVFSFYLNDEGNFMFCEMVRLAADSKFIFFDENESNFESILGELQDKINAACWENFHYQEHLSKKTIKLYRQKGKFIYLYENDIDNYALKKAAERNFEKLLYTIRNYLT